MMLSAREFSAAQAHWISSAFSRPLSATGFQRVDSVSDTAP